MGPSNNLDRKAVRRVLRNWGSLKALGENPLVALPVVRAHQQAAGYSNTELGCGLALREVFQAALESLKPGDGSPNDREKDWRPYIILSEQYVHGRNPDWVMEQLHVSKGTYYGEQERALERLAETLQKWEVERPDPQNKRFQDLLDGGPEANRRIPFLAPPRPAHALVGRDELLQRLKEDLLDYGKQPVVALEGLPGVGKTALAIELAHDAEIKGHFRDGILWAGLGRQPDLLALLGSWATAVGISYEEIANLTSLSERAALIHTAIGPRRMFMIVDDAWQIDAALTFKVGGPNCAYLATTRLVDVALDFSGGQAIPLEELSLEDGAQLLAQIAPEALEAAPHDSRNLVKSVGGLPLALILTGRYLQKQSYRAQIRRLKEALARLNAPEARLQVSQPQSPVEGLHPGLPPGAPLSLQTVIGLSDEALDGAAHRALLDLSLFPPKPNTFSEEAALVVMAAPAQVLDTLVDYGLVESNGQGRYWMHQTICDYASIQGPDAGAITRMVGYFTRLIEAKKADFRELNLELVNILNAVEWAFKTQAFDRLIHLVEILYPFLDTQGLYQISEEFLERASQAAESLGDQAAQAALQFKIGDLEVKRGHFQSAKNYLRPCILLAQAAQLRSLEAESLCSLGLACLYTGDSLQGKNALEQSLSIERELGLTGNAGFTLNGLGFAYEELCDYERAREYLEEALRVCIAGGNRRGEGWVHYNLSLVYLPMGEFAQAQEHAGRCRQIYQELGDRRGLDWLTYQMGRIYRQVGDYAGARLAFDQARQTLEEIGDWMGVGFCTANLGLVAGELGDDAAAEDYYTHALEIFQRIDCLTGVSAVSMKRGWLRRRRGDTAGAILHFEEALQLTRKTGYRRSEGSILANLGLVYYSLGDCHTALGYEQRALEILEEVGARPNLAGAKTFLGEIQLGSGYLDEAAGSFRQALSMREALGQPHLTLEPLAGLARVSLQKANMAEAKVSVEKILGYLGSRNSSTPLETILAGADHPLLVLLTCYRVLRACLDTRAVSMLETARQFLQRRSDRILDEKQRELFLENVPAHREICLLTGQAKGNQYGSILNT